MDSEKSLLNAKNKKAFSSKTPVQGFSKLTKLQKLNHVVESSLHGSEYATNTLKSFWLEDEKLQNTLDEFSENTISNFLFPYGVVPNVEINGKLFNVPMVIEESSVVAAASKSASYWLKRGGFKAEVISTIKLGHVHFMFNGEFEKINNFFKNIKSELLNEVTPLVANMEKRGGGIIDLKLVDKSHLEENYFQIEVEFETCDAMGANFINSVLETFGRVLKDRAARNEDFNEKEKDLQVVMCILTNYTPSCIVRAEVSAPVADLYEESLGMSAEEFATKFKRAIRISKIDKSRATTHNKGIFNGIDAVVLATGNDFRAVEACGHAYASRDGEYRGLSDCSIENGVFKFWLEIPLSVGTVGGLTALHPLAKLSLDMLNKPSARELMGVIAVIGLAQNFGAVRSLVTSGIQKGHMKMHLMNILNHLEATAVERERAKVKFENEIISFNAVREFIAKERSLKN